MESLFEKVFEAPVVVFPLIAFFSYLAYLFAKHIGSYVAKKFVSDYEDIQDKVKELDVINTTLLRTSSVVAGITDTLDSMSKSLIVNDKEIARINERHDDLKSIVDMTKRKISKIEENVHCAKTQIAVIEAKFDKHTDFIE